MANTTSTTPTSDNAFLHLKRVLGDESLEQLTPTLMGLPVEIRQQILSLVRDALYPWDQVILNPSSRHAAQAAARTRPLYNISRTIRAEMAYVGNSWLKQFPMHLAAFEKYVRKPECVNGVLTLVLFDEDFFEYPPAEWREEVQRYSYLFDRIEHSWETNGAAQKGYMNVWNGLIKGLPRRGAKKLGIKAVEVKATSWRREKDRQIRCSALMRTKILLMMKLGLDEKNVKVFQGPVRRSDVNLVCV